MLPNSTLTLPRSIQQLRKDANRLKKSEGITHAEALDQVARQYGANSWAQLMNAQNCSPAKVITFPDNTGAEFSLDLAAKPNAYISLVIGDTGCGKSILAMLIAEQLLDRGNSVAYMSNGLSAVHLNPFDLSPPRLFKLRDSKGLVVHDVSEPEDFTLTTLKQLVQPGSVLIVDECWHLFSRPESQITMDACIKFCHDNDTHLMMINQSIRDYPNEPPYGANDIACLILGHMMNLDMELSGAAIPSTVLEKIKTIFCSLRTTRDHKEFFMLSPTDERIALINAPHIEPLSDV